MAMSGFLPVGNARRLARSLLPRQNTSCLEIKNSGTEFAVELLSFLCRLYSQYKLSNKGLMPYKLCKMKENLWKSYSSKNFYFLSVSNTISHRAHIAWKRLSQICSYTGAVLPPINRIACAVSLALTQSQVVAPGILAFIIGELAWTQRTWVEAERFPTGNTLCMHAQEGDFIHPAEFMQQMLEQVRHHRVNIDGNVCTVMVTMLVLEG